MTPGLMASAMARVDPANWDEATHPGRFSPREVVAHLADWEPILLARMRQCVESPGSEIVPFDEGQMAIENDYAGQDAAQNAKAFQAHRTATIAWLKGISDGDWSKSAHHPERGVMSVYDLANMLVCHDVYHLAQLAGI